MVSQRQIAEAAKVSISTASLALNNHPRVSPRTTLLVQRTAKRLGYVPNHAARQLIRARFGASSRPDIRQIGVASCIKPTKKDALNPTDMAFLNGAEQGVADRAGVLVYLRHANQESARRLADLTRAGTVEGWVVFGYVGDELAELLQGLSRPWVVLGDHSCSRPAHQVTLDFRAMGQLAAQHLLEHGHRRIGFIGSHMGFTYAKTILSGFRESLAGAGGRVPPSAMRLGDVENDTQPWLATVLAEILDSPSPPTALVCAQPGESATVLSLCGERGIRVPEDLSLVFCEMADSLPFVPGVTRVEASAVEEGRSAVSLLAEVAARNNSPIQQLLIAPRTVPGTSVARAKTKKGN